MFVHGKLFHPCLMFVSKVVAYMSGAPEMNPTLGQAPSPTHKYLTRLERLACDKPTSLLRTFVNYGRKKFYNMCC
jgi:hypothetical protein